MDKMLKFDLPKNQSAIIKVIGIGGGGSNAVSYMYNQGIKGVDFIICNTDAQALDASPVPMKIQLGEKGLGAGSIPEVGKEAAIENIEDLKHILEKNTKMVFITAGMGGGTGTGAAPVIAKAAREMGILTVGIVTIPFSFEGRKRKMQAEAGIEELKQNVDTLLLICNDKLRDLHGDLKLSEAFEKADSILSVASKGIAEIITVTGYINVDFEDVKTVMENSGTAIMGSATAEGENRAIKAVEEALASPLLNDNQIKGASDILLYISSGNEEITMDEVSDITDYIQEEAGQSAEIIWGNGIDESLDNMISITLVATGFKSDDDPGLLRRPAKRKIIPLNTIKEEKKERPRITEPINEITLITPKKEEEKEVSNAENPKVENKPLEFSFTEEKIDIKPTDSVEPAVLNETKIQKTEPKPFIPINQETKVRKIGFSEDVEQSDIEKKSKERIRKLKDLSIKLRSNEEIEVMENVPAYKRRNVKLSDVTPSSESVAARYTLGEDENHNPELKENNSYLHDNVD